MRYCLLYTPLYLSTIITISLFPVSTTFTASIIKSYFSISTAEDHFNSFPIIIKWREQVNYSRNYFTLPIYFMPLISRYYAQSLENTYNFAISNSKAGYTEYYSDLITIYTS